MSKSSFYMPASRARNNFFDLIEKVKKGPYPVSITVKGIPEVVMMSQEEYDSWVATFETLADRKLVRSIRQSEKDIKAGRYKPWEQVKKVRWLNDPPSDGKIKKSHVSDISHQSGRQRLQKTG